MLKIGQNWGKIADYPPPMLNKDRHPWSQEAFLKNKKNICNDIGFKRCNKVAKQIRELLQ